jgi:hypothetical protein
VLTEEVVSAARGGERLLRRSSTRFGPAEMSAEAMLKSVMSALEE